MKALTGRKKRLATKRRDEIILKLDIINTREKARDAISYHPEMPKWMKVLQKMDKRNFMEF